MAASLVLGATIHIRKKRRSTGRHAAPLPGSRRLVGAGTRYALREHAHAPERMQVREKLRMRHVRAQRQAVSHVWRQA